MSSAIFFIGGASASGKSETTKVIPANCALPIVELDRLHNILLKRDGTCPEEAIRQTTKDISLEVVKQLLNTGANCIVEGGWIEPIEAKALMESRDNRFQPVFCGYTDTTPEARLEMIRQGKKHWLREKTIEVAHDFIAKQIEGSRQRKEICAELNLPYIDFSDVSAGSEQLIRMYTDWHQRQL